MSTASALQQFLSRLGPDGALACACGREHPVRIKHVFVCEDALVRSAGLLRQQWGESPTLWVLSDEHTEAAAAARWKAGVRAGRILSRVLPGTPRPVPTQALAEELAAEVRAASPDLLIGVGSGVISDLVKKVSLDTGRPNWSIATAPSVDAYSSTTAALRVQGYHQAVPARPSEVIVGDLEVLARAPHRMFLAGLGDLLAKYLAHLDWRLASWVTGEAFCEPIAGLALDSAREAIAAAGAWHSQPREAVRALTEAALASGFAMQALGSSRPAASAEHTIAHFWEMAGAVADEEKDLHGLLVGAACRLVLPGYVGWYRQLSELEPDVDARLTALRQAPPWQEHLEGAMGPFRRKIEGEMRGRTQEPEALAGRLDAFARQQGPLQAMAEPLLRELTDAVTVLGGIGFPFALEELGIDARHQLLPVRHARLLRNRYTTFDLAHELGEEDALLGHISRGLSAPSPPRCSDAG